MVDCKKNSKKIVKYKKYIGINIGTLLFGIVFVYMMVCIVMYLTSTHIAPYEVKKAVCPEIINIQHSH